LWQQLEENGLTLPQIPEAHGGAGGEWGDAQVVLAAAGRFAVPLPVAETMIGAWLLSARRLHVPPGALTVARAGGAVAGALPGGEDHERRWPPLREPAQRAAGADHSGAGAPRGESHAR